MNSFIEVTTKTAESRKVLININHIEGVTGSTIYFAYNTPNAFEQDNLVVQETYEEIKKKIEIAQCDTDICDIPDNAIKAQWKYWGGWVGNHDLRLEDATCTNCGYIHPAIRSNRNANKMLPDVCPACGAKIIGHITT